MSKSALKFIVSRGISPQQRLIRQNTIATDRTQERKRPSRAMVRPAGTSKP